MSGFGAKIKATLKSGTFFVPEFTLNKRHISIPILNYPIDFFVFEDFCIIPKVPFKVAQPINPQDNQIGRAILFLVEMGGEICLLFRPGFINAMQIHQK